MKNVYQVTDFNYLYAIKKTESKKKKVFDKKRNKKTTFIDGRLVRMSVFSAITAVVILLGALLF